MARSSPKEDVTQQQTHAREILPGGVRRVLTAKQKTKQNKKMARGEFTDSDPVFRVGTNTYGVHGVYIPLGRTDGVHVACLVSRLEPYSHEAMITELQLVAGCGPDDGAVKVARLMPDASIARIMAVTQYVTALPTAKSGCAG